tara:strand:- start:97 stop:396 length:300 start_codon:yes stop_codon:yes gene_type:complete
MITKTLNKYDFINEFETSTERQNQFSYNALSSLYDYYDDMSHCLDMPYDFDMIAICCDFTEYNTIEEAAEAYSISPIELEDKTTVLHVLENGHVVVQNY